MDSRIRSSLNLAATLVMFFAGAIMIPAGIRAQTIFEKLVMPGPLIEGHAKLEKDCKNCHEAFSKKAQDKLCLTCHKKINQDVKSRRGFHGLRQEVAKSKCKHCHTDHKGRNKDIINLDVETFNHAQTDFKLTGAHKTARCSGCHKPKIKFRDAPNKCIDCHKAVEPHKGRLGKKCATCHFDKSWRPAKAFDHSKTKFALKGPHKKVACKSCHVNEHYKDIGRACLSCHSLQDVHEARFGAKCETCHAPSKWKKVRFDHTKNTKFPLRGSHKKVKCKGCHKGDLYKVKLKTRCVACHKKKDPHKGQLGDRCERCHNETKWRQNVLFDHDLTRFPLAGKHARAKCKACHKSRSFKDVPRRCAGCHKDKHHLGRLGQRCATCHNPAKWARWRFDHDRQTKFRLTGAHKNTHCHGCHRVKHVVKPTAPQTCYACHNGDDKHRGAFGRSCERCHNTSTFRVRARR